MKKIMLTLALGCLLLPCTYSQSVWSEAAEKQAIMKTIERETECFYKRDYKGWKETWVQADYIFQAWSNQDGTFDASVGWEKVDGRIGKYIKENPVPEGGSSHPKVERRNMVVKFFNENLAYLVWDQYNMDKDKKYYTLSKDERLMEKQNGTWKIANVSSFWDYKNTVPVEQLKN